MNARGGIASRNLVLSEEIVRAILDAVDDDVHGTETHTVCERLDESPQRLGEIFEFIKEKGILLGFAGLWFHPERYAEGEGRFLRALDEHHLADPNDAAVDPARVAREAGLDWTGKATRRIVRDLVAERRLKGDDARGVRLPGFVPKIPIRQQVALERIVAALDAGGFHPLGGNALARAVNLPTQALAETLRAGEHTERLVPLGGDIWLTREGLDAVAATIARAHGNGEFTVADARTALDTSRRFAFAFLEGLESEGRAAVVEGRWRLTQ